MLGVLRLNLSYFQTISLDMDMLKIIDVLKGYTRYANLIKEYDSLQKLVNPHNVKILALQEDFNNIIENNPIEKILNNIDNYSLVDLEKINEIAIIISKYTIPDSFKLKEKFLIYILQIGEITDNYQDIVEQYSLLNSFELIVGSLPDDYLDQNDAYKISSSLSEILLKFKKFPKKYFDLPDLDQKLIEKHNQKFINDHISDKIFDDINGKSLDFEQRRAILCDSKSNLTIAGAGAGKTLTICGKVKWLLEHKNLNENDILLLSYSKESARDLNLKVSKVRDGLTVKTFHSLGLDILNNVNGSKQTIEENFKTYIHKFFSEELNNNPPLAYAIMNFYSLYLYTNSTSEKQYKTDGEEFEDLKKANYKTLKDRLSQISDNNEKHETIQKEFVKSYEELAIANWLYINGIKYEYERAYEINTSTPEKRQYTPDFYLTDYGIYLEHYGVNSNWKTPQYTSDKEQEYLKGIEWKRKTHQENDTICIETYSYEFSDGSIFDQLKVKLENKGVKINPITQEDLFNSLNTIYLGQDLKSLFNLVMTFLGLYKAQYADNSGFDKLKAKFSNEYERKRAKEFLTICKGIYDYYINEIRKQGKIDFDDMILQSTNALDKTNGYKYKYIIVDEFQDISISRKRFLDKIIKHGRSKLFAVGDDWQSIYRFAGCDVNIFLHFERLFEDAKLNYITSTHRNSSELQSIVEPFITANPEQYKKHIHSAKHQDNPIRIIYHRDDRESAFFKALNNISKINTTANVLVLGRNKHDIDCMISSELQVKDYNEIICRKYPNFKISYKTVHGSKGLESDYVILISGDDAKNGFPNKMEDDQLLQLVLGDEGFYEFAEERRLFYVALTRTRSIVYILADRVNTSVFVKEIELRAKIENPELKKLDNVERYTCPWCKSGQLILRKSSSNNEFYGCSNYPYCDYAINDLKAVKTNNRCPECGDFLTIRNGKFGRFIGCHNYPRCRHTRQLKN